MKVHENIKFFRQQKRWTQEDLADKLDMSPNGYGDIERGDTDITWSRLEQIAQIFEMDVLDLIGFDEKNIFHIKNTRNSGHHWNLATTTGNQNQSSFENEKLQLINTQLEKEITYLKQEVEHLKEIIDLLKQK
jgi:transcriptional regulator with XRE-family HTH domain